MVLRKRDLQCCASVSIETSSTAKRSPFSYKEKALMTLRVGNESCKLRRAKLCHPAGPRTGALNHERRRGEAQRRQGWVGGVYPSAQIQGADSGFRRTLCLHPRRAQRRAQVCGDSTVQSDGQWAGSPHPPLPRSPFPSRGRTIRRSNWGETSSSGRFLLTIDY